MAISDSDFIKLAAFFSKHNIEKSDMCLVGSISLANIGIRDNNDIDLIIK